MNKGNIKFQHSIDLNVSFFFFFEYTSIINYTIQTFQPIRCFKLLHVECINHLV